MKSGITPAALFDAHHEKLGLVWVAGRSGAQRPIQGEHAEGPNAEGYRPIGWVGHMNVVHPHCIQVLGPVEGAWLAGLTEADRRRTLQQLVGARPALIVVTDGQPVPEPLAALAEESGTPLV